MCTMDKYRVNLMFTYMWWVRAAKEFYGKATKCISHYTFVIGFWKTEQNVTLGLFYFITPADSYTHTPPMYSGIIRLS